MNIAMWILAGGSLGWAGCAFLGFNEGRGNLVSIIIGAIGGFFGGKMVAPMFAAASVTGDFSSSALLVAAAVAAAFLGVGHLVHNRWGV
jgi:uncharacterized membrane protein YeaQ/YmgE (transglycosylase-associated protein family)